MQARKLDNVFKSKVGNHQSELSSHTWGKMEALLDVEEKTNSKILHWRMIAASVVLILGAMFLFTSYEKSSDVISKTNELKEVQRIVMDIEIFTSPEFQIQPQQVNLIDGQSVVAKNIEDPSEILEEKNLQERTAIVPELDKSLESGMIAYDQLEISEEMEVKAEESIPKKRMPIRITYKRGPKSIVQNESYLAGNETDSLKTNKIKKFIEDKKLEIKDSQLWADVKSAKEKLTSKNSNNQID